MARPVPERGFAGPPRWRAVRGGVIRRPATSGRRGRDGFVHTVVCPRDEHELARAVRRFVSEGVAAGEPVFANLAPERLAGLRAAVGSEATAVRWSDTFSWEPHPGCRLRAIQDLVARVTAAGERRLRFVGECAWPDGSRALQLEWERFDAALNHALSGTPVTMMCVYDAARLPRPILERVAATHPFGGARPRPNRGYVAPEVWLEAHRAEPLPCPPSAPRVHGRVSAVAARALVHGVAGDLLPGTALDALEVAVTEVVTNALRMGSGAADVRCWASDAEVVVQVDDDGPGFGDPLAGYRRPTAGAEAGRGLWMVRQLTDVMHVSDGATGTSVQLRVLRRPASPLR